MNIETIWSRITGSIEDAVSSVAQDYWREAVGECRICGNKISRGEFQILAENNFEDGCMTELFGLWQQVASTREVAVIDPPESPPTGRVEPSEDVPLRQSGRPGLEPRRAAPVRRSAPPQVRRGG